MPGDEDGMVILFSRLARIDKVKETDSQIPSEAELVNAQNSYNHNNHMCNNNVVIFFRLSAHGRVCCLLRS